jgi:predicted TIM-barrel fold metal-dependent hydrolase
MEEAVKRGVKKLLVNHPSYLIDATEAEMGELVRMGAYLEHSMCMFVPGSKFHFYTPENLDNLIKAGTVDKTILGSDLGQMGNPTPVEGFKNVIATCLDLKYSHEDIKKMTGGNAADLLGIN